MRNLPLSTILLPILGVIVLLCSVPERPELLSAVVTFNPVMAIIVVGTAAAILILCLVAGGLTISILLKTRSHT